MQKDILNYGKILYDIRRIRTQLQVMIGKGEGTGNCKEGHCLVNSSLKSPWTCFKVDYMMMMMMMIMMIRTFLSNC